MFSKGKKRMPFVLWDQNSFQGDVAVMKGMCSLGTWDVCLTHWGQTGRSEVPSRRAPHGTSFRAVHLSAEPRGACVVSA